MAIPIIKLIPPELIGGKTYYADTDGNILNAKGRKLKPLLSPGNHISRPNMHGAYPQVNIDGKRPTVHKLVCTAFWGLPKPNHVCHHLDGNKFNNRPDNLIWVSREEHPNFDRAVRNGVIYKHVIPNDYD